MADGTSIEWARHPVTKKGASWNPLLARRRDTGKLGYHCEHVTEACRFCYAETFNRRNLPGRGTGLAFKPGHRKDIEILVDRETLLLPKHWRDPRGIFVCSMTDAFGEFVGTYQIDELYTVMAVARQHVFFVLSKRPGRGADYLNGIGRSALPQQMVRRMAARLQGKAEAALPWPLPNVWHGTSVHDLPSAELFIPQLLSGPAAVHWISAEPLLGPIDLRSLRVRHDVLLDAFTGRHRRHPDCEGMLHLPPLPRDYPKGLDWVVAGGESGAKARPSHPDWFRALRDQCGEAGVPFLFKQWGEWAPHDEGGWLARDERRELARMGGAQSGKWHPETDTFRVGKKAAGRLLDGRVHDDMPELVAA